MSVVFKNNDGWFLDQCSHASKGYERCLAVGGVTASKYFKCTFKSQYFEMAQPHISEKRSVDNAGHLQVETGDKYSAGTKKRKRKHKELNQGEIDSQAYHEKVRTLIVDGAKPLVQMGLSLGHPSTGVDDGEAPPACGEDGLADLCSMAKLCDECQCDPVQFIGDDLGFMEQLDLFSRMTESLSTCAREVTLLGERYILPPRCSFLLSDISRLQPLVKYGKKFDAIVMDPPWENKSVKRSRRYDSLPSSQLLQLPVPILSSPGCVVATWVTNRQKHRRFVRDVLYPRWGVEVQAEWLWVKITRAGEFVYPLDSPHKKPYEVLLIGRYRGDVGVQTGSPVISDVHIPKRKLIVSIPSTLHSHKPSLADVLKEFLPPEAPCLELFARNLHPGWTSWGNQVLKFQHSRYFHTDVSPSPSTSPPNNPQQDCV